MSALLSADDLNDFISPGVACIKPVETLAKRSDLSNPYEVTTEDKVQAENPPPVSISLTDCLACSGCVTSAEAVLISLQSHTEVLNTLDAHTSFDVRRLLSRSTDGPPPGGADPKLFVASISPQVRASLAATYQISERQAGFMIEQLLSGPKGLRGGGRQGSGFAYVVDTNGMREACLALGADEVAQSSTGASTARPRPILTSACPGWICYAEKTHPHVLPHLSKLKSPQALTGTLLKSVLSKAFGIHPSQIWHLAVMPCFDKKLEASREELTDRWWAHDTENNGSTPSVRDVDCVITSRELFTLANERGIDLSSLPLTPLSKEYRPPFPEPRISEFIFPKARRRGHLPTHDSTQSTTEGTSGGYLHHILMTQQSLHPGSTIYTQRGRNADVVEYTLLSVTQQPIFKCARFYGFRNIQNLVRKLKPTRVSRLLGAAAAPARRGAGGGGGASAGSEYAYVEVMACPGGCTNGGGQIRVDEAVALQRARSGKEEQTDEGPVGKDMDIVPSQRQWLQRVDSAYFSATSSVAGSDSGSNDGESAEEIDEMHDARLSIEMDNHLSTDGPSATETAVPDRNTIHALLSHWSEYTSIPLDKLVYTTFRRVESQVGKSQKGHGEAERVAVLAGSVGGGW